VVEDELDGLCAEDGFVVVDGEFSGAFPLNLCFTPRSTNVPKMAFLWSWVMRDPH